MALYLVASVTSLLTAFYMFRLLWLAFFGASRLEPEVAHHVHESPWSMTGVLIVLALLSAIGGFVALPHFLEPMLPIPAVQAKVENDEHLVVIVSIVLAFSGLAAAAWFYAGDAARATAVRLRFAALNRLLAGKYFVDELYDVTINRPLLWLSDRVVLRLGDRFVLDGSLNGMAKIAQAGAGVLSRLQDGSVQRYVAFVLIGSTACLLWILRHG